MPIQMWFTVFISVFLAELGDKTQLATLCYAADDRCSPLGVFLAASAALILTSFLGVMVGSQVSRFVSPHHVKIVAGFAFVLIGAWYVWEGFKG